jgi:hypothetical protein
MYSTAGQENLSLKFFSFLWLFHYLNLFFVYENWKGEDQIWKFMGAKAHVNLKKEK